MSSCTYPAGNVSATKWDDEPGSASDFNGKRRNGHVVGFRRMPTPSSVVSKTHGLKLVASFLSTKESELLNGPT